MTLPAPVLFGAHLFVFLAALAGAAALARERGRGAVVRGAGALGFLTLAGAEAYHGAGLAGDAAPETAWARTAGYALLAVAAVPRRRPGPGAGAIAVLPGAAALPVASGVVAAALTWWRRRGERGGLSLAAGLLLLAAGDGILGLDRDWAASAGHLVHVAGYLAVAGAAVALTRTSVRFRFLVGLSGLLVGVVLFVSVAIGTVIDRNLREGALGRLLGQAEEAQGRVVDLISDEVGTLVAVSEVGAIAEAIQRGRTLDPELIEALRARLFPDVDFVLFLDRDGRVLGRLGLDPAAGVELVATEAVDFALRRGQDVSSLDTLPSGGLVLVGVAPIRRPGAGEPTGFAAGGFFLDEDILRREVLSAPQTRAAVFQGFRGRRPVLVAAAGFPEGAAEPVASPEIVEEAYRRFLRGEGAIGRAMSLGGEPHFAALAPMRQAVGRPVGILVVAEPAGVLGATRRQVNQVLFVVTVAVIGLTFVLAIATARRITRPLVALTEATRRVQAGDLAAKAQVRGEDEVADLAVAFNRMTDSVSGMTEELREAAAEQSALRARLETVVNSMGDGLIAVDARGRIVTYNPAAAAIVGRSADAVVGHPVREVLHLRDGAGRPLAESALPVEGLAFLPRPGATDVPVAMSSAPLRDPAGAELGHVYVLRDMTREYELDRMKREFLANVSHELRTPLTPIVGYAELMSRRELPGERTREFAGSILESARRLERIVAMLVDFSAIEAGRLPVATKPTDLRPVVLAAVEAWRERSDRHAIEAEVPHELPAARVSPELFRRMLDELIDNALKYSPEGGRVEVRVGEDGRRGMLRVAVSDQGIGIKADDLARIFQEFRQVDASSTRTFGGLGLGLSFVKRLTEAHGGEVSAASEPGLGSTFTFTVPAADTTKEKMSPS